jgi:GH18 family chitinase
MVQYGFDGVDLDWEYPGAPDRGGQIQDVNNYPLLLQMIKFKFQVERKDFGISITAPTSYWYLRWFNLIEIVKYVNFINLMSYDLHGIWDSTDPIGPYIYAHTNLTEIDLALDLFWRNNISPSMINLGLAFYGRTFQLTDPSCITPGCGFSGPGLAGPCTATPGILSYNEIQNILSQSVDQYQMIYDQNAGVNYLVWGENNCTYPNAPLLCASFHRLH